MCPPILPSLLPKELFKSSIPIGAPFILFGLPIGELGRIVFIKEGELNEVPTDDETGEGFPPTVAPGASDVGAGLEGLVPNPGIPKRDAIMFPASEARPSEGAVEFATVG
jgi:hypothetical protein